MNALLKKIIGKFGLELRRTNPKPLLNLYNAYTPSEIEEKRFYNLGAGSFSHPYWTNIDKKSEWYKGYAKVPFIEYDLFSLQPLPIAAKSASIIYCSHTLEHVNDASVKHLLSEAYKALKPGGYLRIITPNIELQYRAYVENDRDYFFWIDSYSAPDDVQRSGLKIGLDKASTAQIFLEDFASYASELPVKGSEKRISDDELKKLFETKTFEEALNHCTALCSIDLQKQSPQNHINWFSERKLRRMLQEAGFQKIYQSAYGQSHCSPLRDINFFDTTLPKVSLYMEAVK